MRVVYRGVTQSMFGGFLVGLLCLACAESSTPSGTPQNDAQIDSALSSDFTVDAEVRIDGLVPDSRIADILSVDAFVSDQLVDADLANDMSVDLGPSTGPYTTAQVDEIFQRGCGSCHNSTANPPLGGGVASWINRGSGQSPLPLIAPGNHQRSYLYHKLADTHLSSPSNGRGTGMPMGRQLYSESRLERIAGWIDTL